MPEHLRALAIILLLAAFAFALASRLTTNTVPKQDFIRRRNLWFTLTLVAFLSNSFWLYFYIFSLLMLFNLRKEKNIPGLFFLLLFLLPPASLRVSGLGWVNYLIDLNHIRILEIIILLPTFFHLTQLRSAAPFGRNGTDKLLSAYLLLIFALNLRDTTITDALRQGLYLWLDIFLPYFVLSRTLTSLNEFKVALSSFFTATLVLALIAIFELSRHWYLYSGVVYSLGLEWTLGGYLDRASMLRAIVTTGQAIVLGFVFAISIGFYLFLAGTVYRNILKTLGGLLLVAGLIAPLSRGPWIGAAVITVTFIVTGRFAIRRVTMLSLAALVALLLLSLLPGGEKVTRLLPFLGSVETETFTYREQLLDNSLIVIGNSPWFGSANYLNTPELESLRQGLGIIDIVNTYLQVALESGYVGLSLFCGVFALVLFGIYRAMKILPEQDVEMYRLGQALLATLLGTLLMIANVSKITFVPTVYWSVAGLGVAYAEMVRKRIKGEAV